MFVSLIILISACTVSDFLAIFPETATSAQEVEVLDEALIQHGIDTYLASYCGICHELAAANTRGTFGPPHNELALVAIERLQSKYYSGRATNVEDYIRESIIDPQAFIIPDYAASSHAMPSFSYLSATDIDALVYMLSHQTK